MRVLCHLHKKDSSAFNNCVHPVMIINKGYDVHGIYDGERLPGTFSFSLTSACLCLAWRYALDGWTLTSLLYSKEQKLFLSTDGFFAIAKLQELLCLCWREHSCFSEPF